MCSLANAMADRGHSVSLFYSHKYKHATPFYELNAKLPLYKLPEVEDRENLYSYRELLLKLSLDLFCGFLWNKETKICLSILHKTNIPFIYTERCSPSHATTVSWNKHEHAYCTKKSDAIVLLCDDFKKYYNKNIHHKIHIIGNAIPPSKRHTKSNDNNKVLLAVGRMKENPKQFSILISAFFILSNIFPNWILKLCGDGEDQLAYKKFAKNLQIDDRVQFSGNIKNIGAEYAGADLFCIPSSNEGFPNVLGEAMSAGLPSVGFSECPGVNSLIIHGKNGLLAEGMTAESLANNLFILMKNDILRQHMGAEAKKLSQNFLPAIIHDKWEIFFSKIAKKTSQNNNQ